MIENDILKSALPMAALDVIPEPEANASQITGLIKDGGSVTGYQLSNGACVSKEEGVALAKEGEIKGVGVAHRNGKEYLKSLPDGSENNNLSKLPTVNATTNQMEDSPLTAK